MAQTEATVDNVSLLFLFIYLSRLILVSKKLSLACLGSIQNNQTNNNFDTQNQ